MPGFESSEVFLHPGQVFFGDQRYVVKTILGSCVALTMWHPGRRVGGMCHLLLPVRTGLSPIKDLDGRYGQEAVLWLLQEINRRDSNPYEYDVQLYGGGRMFRRSRAGDSLDVGGRNVAYLRKFMQELGFYFKFSDVGQAGSRWLAFDIANGRIVLQRRADALGREPAQAFSTGR